MVRFNGTVPNVNQATRRNDTCRYSAGGVRAPVHARGRIRCSLFPWRTLFLNPTDGLGEEVRPRMTAGANSATCTAADLINARPTNGACDVLRTGRNASATSQYADRSSCPGKLSPSLSCVRKELQPDKSEEDKRQGTYTTSICALAKKDHSNHRGSRGGDPDEACVDGCRRETLNGFGQQVIYGNGAEHTHQQRCPSREWRGPFQNERPCDFEKICEKDEEPRHRLSLDEDSERRALDGPRG